jgi:hypothetical protein
MLSTTVKVSPIVRRRVCSNPSSPRALTEQGWVFIYAKSFARVMARKLIIVARMMAEAASG